MYQKTTLGNGLRIVTAEIPQARSVSISLFLASGSRHEVADESQGISHFIEHMLFKGTEKRPTSKEISETIEGIGGIFNAESSKEATVYWNKVARVHWPVALEVLLDLLLHSVFRPEDIEKERKVITEELSSMLDSPGEWVHVLADHVIWGEDPLGRDVGGTPASVGAINREQLLAYLHEHYVPANAVLAVAGALTHDEIVERVAELVSEWQPGPATRWRAYSANGQNPAIELKTKRTEQAHVCIVYPCFSYRDPDRYALDLMNVLLGEGMSSRLFLEIREARGLAYDVHSYINHFSDTGSLVVYAGVDPSQIDETLAGCLAEIDKLRATGITAEELTRAKEYWKGRTLLRMEDTRSIASWIGGQELLLGEILDVEDVVRLVEAVTLDDVQRVINRVLVPDRASLALIGPYRSERRFRRALSQTAREPVAVEA